MQISALNVQFNCKYWEFFRILFLLNNLLFFCTCSNGRKEGIFILCTILNIIHLQWWVVLLTLVIQNSPPRRRQTLWEDHHGQSGTISKWFPSPVRKNYPLEWEFLSPIKETLYHCPSSIDAEKMKETDEPDFTFPPPAPPSSLQKAPLESSHDCSCYSPFRCCSCVFRMKNSFSWNWRVQRQFPTFCILNKFLGTSRPFLSATSHAMPRKERMRGMQKLWLQFSVQEQSFCHLSSVLTNNFFEI